MEVKKQSLKSSLLALLSALFFLLFLTEFGYRGYVFLAKPHYRLSSLPGLGWEYTPGASWLASSKETGKAPYRINSLGFRDLASGKWQPWKAEDLKIAFLGDSVTAGAELAYEKTFAFLTEQGLSRRLGKPVRVVNGAIEATNSLQHLALLREKILKLDPDVVILGYFMNDIDKRQVEKLPHWVQWVLRYWHFAGFLLQRIRTFWENHHYSESSSGMSQIACSAYASMILARYETPDWLRIESALRQMKELCRQKGIRFAVAVFPFEEQVRGDCVAKAQKKLTTLLASEEIPFLDIREVFGEERSPQALYLRGDNIHLSSQGHQQVARTLSDWVFKIVFER